MKRNAQWNCKRVSPSLYSIIVFFCRIHATVVQKYDRSVIYQAQHYYQHCLVLWKTGWTAWSVRPDVLFFHIINTRTHYSWVWVENNNGVIQHRIMKFWINTEISRYFSLTVQTGCGAHPASFQWLLWALRLGGTVAHWSNRSLTSVYSSRRHNPLRVCIHSLLAGFSLLFRGF